MPRKKKILNEVIRDNKETISKRQEKIKGKFLEKIQEIPFVSSAATFTGINRSTFYRCKKEDPMFAHNSE
jgi:hypothetical protein